MPSLSCHLDPSGSTGSVHPESAVGASDGGAEVGTSDGAVEVGEGVPVPPHGLSPISAFHSTPLIAPGSELHFASANTLLACPRLAISSRGPARPGLPSVKPQELTDITK